MSSFKKWILISWVLSLEDMAPSLFYAYPSFNFNLFNSHTNSMYYYIMWF